MTISKERLEEIWELLTEGWFVDNPIGQDVNETIKELFDHIDELEEARPTKDEIAEQTIWNERLTAELAASQSRIAELEFRKEEDRLYTIKINMQLTASQARVARLEEALNDVFSVLNSPLEPNTKGVFDQNSQMASKAHTAWVILREALNTPESPDSSKGA